MQKYNPHKRCACRACRAGNGTRYGQYIRRAVNRKIRHEDRLKLRCYDAEDYVDTIISTPYTD